MAPRVIRLLVVEDSPAYLNLVQMAFRQHVGQTRWEIVLAELSLVFHHSIRTLSAFDLHQSVSQVAV